jgi:hypothetical protein
LARNFIKGNKNITKLLKYRHNFKSSNTPKSNHGGTLFLKFKYYLYMKFTLNILIDFFASLYDLVYDSVNFLLKSVVKLALHIKKTSLLNMLIVFFASLYDLVYDFIVFLGEYVKWATDMRSYKSSNFSRQTKEPIQIDNQTPFGTL